MSYSQRPGDTDFPLTRNVPGASREPLSPQPLKVNSLRQQAQRRNSTWTYTKRALAAMFCLFCVMAGTLAGNFYWKSDFARLFIGGMLKNPTDPLAEFTPEKQLPLDKQHVITVLLLGLDKDYDPRKPIPIKNSRGRSDAILLCQVDFDRRTIRALSIPRDTAVTFPNERGIHKINAAHSVGGPEMTRDTIRYVFGIPVDYYATLDFDGFQKVVDAIGGVEVNVPKAMKYDDNWGNLHIDLKPGLQRLTGYEAMGFVRMRHNDNDLARAERQQQFLEALRSQVKSPGNFRKLPDVLGALESSIQTNMTHGQMLALGNFARTLERKNVELKTLPVTQGRSFVYINVNESEDLIRTLFYPDGLTPVGINAPARQVANNRSTHRKRSRRERRVNAVTPVAGNESTEANSGETTETNPAPEPESTGNTETTNDTPPPATGSGEDGTGMGTSGDPSTIPGEA